MENQCAKSQKCAKAHNRAIQRYRNKQRQQQKKRVETWIQQPECLEDLKKQSGLNQTEVINTLLEIVSDGVSREFFHSEEQSKENVDYMCRQLIEFFQKY